MSLDEYKKLVKELEEDLSVDKILKVIEMTESVGFLNLVKDDDLKDFLPSMREKIGELSADDLKKIIPKFLPVMFKGMQELLEASEEAQEELEDIDDMSILISVPDMNINIFMKIEDGKFSAGEGDIEDPSLKIKMAEETFMKMATGDLDAMQAYMSGEVQLEGDMTKAMALRPLLDVLADEYDFDIGLMG
ncbi:MAG: SCP2 sterol-binding domain-containing protein [Candidatus Helarchaeota archaeon]